MGIENTILKYYLIKEFLKNSYFISNSIAHLQGDNNNPILNGQRGGEGRGSGQLLPRFGQFGNSGNSGRIRQSRSASNSSESIASPRWNGTQTEIGRRNCSHQHHRGERRFGGDRPQHNRHNQTH